MIRPTRPESHYRQRPSLHTRRPNRPQTGPQTGYITLQEPESAPSTASASNASGIGTRFISWLTGSRSTPNRQHATEEALTSDDPPASHGQIPGYQDATEKGKLNIDTLHRIEDLRTVLQEHSPSHGKLQLLVKDHLNVPPDMSAQEQQRLARQLIYNGETEFFLNLEEAENLPANIAKKYCNPDDDSASFVLNEGIGFMLPTKILPPNFQPNNKESVKSWLGLDSNVDFHLYGNRRNFVA